MINFLIRSARDLVAVSWIAVVVGAYLAISEANRLADIASISDEARYAMIGTAVVVAVIYTSICGASLVMFGVHDRLSEISNSLALVADKFCNDERHLRAPPALVADTAARGSIVEPNSSDTHKVRGPAEGDGEGQLPNHKTSWWADASFGEKAVIIFICLIPIGIWMAAS